MVIAPFMLALNLNYARNVAVTQKLSFYYEYKNCGVDVKDFRLN